MNEIQVRTEPERGTAAESITSTSGEAGEASLESPEETPIPVTYPAPVHDRRASPRYPAIKGRSWLSWYDGDQRAQIAALILNISVGGCVVAVDEPVPDDRALWLRLDDPDVNDWTEVRLVGHVSGNGGIGGVRFAFADACPYETLAAVAFPTESESSRPRPPRSWSLNIC